MAETILSERVPLRLRDFQLLLGPYFQRGYAASGGETLHFEAVKSGANHYSIAIRTDRHEAKRARLEQALQAISEQDSAVSGMGRAPNDPPGYPGFRWDSHWGTGTYPPVGGEMAKQASPTQPEEKEAINEAEFALLSEKYAAVEAELATLAPCAGLELYRQPGGRLLLELIDGYAPQSPHEANLPATGQALVEFAECLTQIIEGHNNDVGGEEISNSSETRDRDRPDWPAPPAKNAAYNDWFDWYHHISDKLEHRLTLQELAKMMHLSYSHVRKLHVNYMAEHSPEMEQ